VKIRRLGCTIAALGSLAAVALELGGRALAL